MNKKVQYALVTGATSGIGYELAKLFAKNGYNLVIVARGEEELHSIATDFSKTYGVVVISFTRNLFHRNASYELYNLIKARGIQVDILVNNAGQDQYGEFVDTVINSEIDIIQLNITSLVVLTKFFLKEMVERKSGKILNVASIGGKIPGPLQAVYHGTKAFVHSFTEAIRNEVKDNGITITSLLPGATDTDFFNKAGMLEAKNVQEEKLADPAEVAQNGYDALMKGEDMVISGLKINSR